MDGIEARDEAKLARSYLDRARELQPMLRAAGDEIERHRQLPESVVEALVERGIFKMLLPRSIGGAELEPADRDRRPRIAGAGRRQHRVVAWPEFRLLDDRALPPAGERPRDFRRPARHPRLGARAAGRRARRRGRRRLPGHRAMGLRHRQPARQLARLPHSRFSSPTAAPASPRTEGRWCGR